MKEKYRKFFQTIKINIIVAVAENGVIGLNNQLPWKLDGELQHFKRTTMGHVVVVGRKTCQSMPPLKGRTVAAISKDYMEYSNKDKNAVWCPDLPSAIFAPAMFKKDYKECWIAGGSSIYQEAFRLNLVDQMYITHVKGSFEGDSFFHIPEGWEPVSTLNETDQYIIKVWEKK